jgi:uncharacterized protein YneF (UPF0154 family)
MNWILAIILTVLIFGAAVLILSYIDKKKREKKLKEIKPAEVEA